MKPVFFLVLAVLSSLANAETPAETARRLTETPGAAVEKPAAAGVAGVWLRDYPAGEMARSLARRPELVPGVFGTLGAALAVAGDEDAAALLDYTTAVTRTWSRHEGPWSDDGLQLLTALVLVDPSRFLDDERLRGRVAAALPRAIDPAAPSAVRDRVLAFLSRVPGLGFDAFEDAGFAWGSLVRKSGGRRYEGGGLVLPGEREPIRASVYSLPDDLFTAEDALAFLHGVHLAAPERDLVVLTGGELGERLRPKSLGLHVVPTHGFAFSPWPRDPLTFLRDGEGRQVVFLRPNSQSTREDDLWLGRVLVEGLPDDLDAAWGGLRYQRATVPFHNGQILEAGDRLWVSLHSLEPRALELTGFDRVPVAELAGPPGARYLAAVRKAAAELGELYGRRVAFVHPLPADDAPGAERAKALLPLGGGAGFDLDSLVTLLVTSGGGTTALVADLDAGSDLLAAAGDDELAAFAAGYGLVPPKLRELQESPRARRLDAFLEAVASHLATGATVRRLPLLLLPQGAGEGYSEPDFLVGWQNVVLEERDGVARAEGFASLLPSGDRRAREVYAEAGYRLDLLPPLVGSVRRNGGYRCASQHVR